MPSKLMGILMHDVAVLEGAGLGLVGVADQVDGLGVIRRDEGPFDAGGEARTAASAQAAGFDFFDDGFGGL
jgi:hypothetical protein